MLAALHYTFVKTPEDAGKVFGLQVAILDWVRAWFRYGTQEKIPVLLGDAAAQGEILEAAALAGLDPARLMLLDQRRARENFGNFDVVFRADPDPANVLWQRQQIPGRRFAFCGLSHAMAGIEGGKVLEQYCLAPTIETDAIVCPSQAVASAIRSFWDHYAKYLHERFRASYYCPVQLPVIPLGIDIEKYAAKSSPDKRAAQRAQLGAAENDIILLWVGRLSHAIKAHPIAMFEAAERAAQLTGANVHLVMQGYFMPAEAAPQFAKLAQDICQTAKVSFIAKDDARFPDGLWAGADIFLSLVDNMQESFGLTPIEAMAAGLPRVVSDWDGYRECVTSNEDGYLVRTLTPPAGSGHELSELLLNGREIYGGFLAKTALSTAVDIDMAAAALKILIEDKSKRKRMAEKARTRAQAAYDWRAIIPAYERLWNELASRRGSTGPGMRWPVVPDPFAIYDAYPTAQLQNSDRIHVTASAGKIRMLLSHDLNVFGLDMMIAPDDITRLIREVSAHNGVTIAELQKSFAADSAGLWRTLGWLIKLGIFRSAG